MVTGQPPWAIASTSEMTATAVGLPPAPWPEKTVSPPYWPPEITMFSVPRDHDKGELRGTSIGPTVANSS